MTRDEAELLGQRIDALKELVEAWRQGDHLALSHAQTELERRLEEMNQFRAQIDRERRDYISREVYDQRHSELDRQIRLLENRVNSAAGEGQGVRLSARTFGLTVAAVAGIIGIVVAVSNWFSQPVVHEEPPRTQTVTVAR